MEVFSHFEIMDLQGNRVVEGHKVRHSFIVFTGMLLTLRGTVKSKAPLRVQFSPALGGRGWERVKAEASPRLY